MDLISVLEKINKSSLRFLQPLTPESTYQTIIEEALKLVSGDEGYIALAEEGELTIKYAYPLALGSIKMRKRGFSYTSFSQKKAFVTYTEEFKDIHPELVKAGIQSTIFIPLANKGKSIGVMNIMSRHRLRRFSQKELSILKLFGSLANMAIIKTQLYAETKATLEAHDLFLSLAAHEFRTPITTVSGYAQLIKSKIKKGSLENRWAEEMYKETQRLTRLVNELLQVNRIRLKQFHYKFQECNLTELLEKVVKVFQISHPKLRLNLKSTISRNNSVIIADSDKITQVITNLVDNAIKFSPQPIKKVDLTLKESNENLIVQVKDYGVGIAQQDLDKVFRGYYKGANNTHEGMGLGLYLSNLIIREHRGKINIKSEIDKGTTIQINLPKANNH